jgi:protein ImuB
VADGGFAATLAARRSAVTGDAVVVEEGGTPPFLAGFPTRVLDRPELVDVLERLGLQRLGQFAALSPADVTARFGADGALAHRLARGLDPRPPHLSEPPTDLEVVSELDPPLERVDQAAFVAKVMADDLHERLAQRGLAAVAILISGTTTDGHCVERRWRHDGALSSAGVAQRLRWQLDGWLTHSRSTAGALIRLSLRPEDVVADVGRQQSLWGGSVATDARALGAVARVQGILGSDAVRMAEWHGGRSPAEQYRLVPVDLIDRESSPSADQRPWPGRLPEPPPALVWHRSRRCEVVGDGGEAIAVDGRGMASGIPLQMSIESGSWQPIARWAGPWVTDERWWDAVAHRRRARFQVALADGTAHLVTLEAGSWWIEATYD